MANGGGDLRTWAVIGLAVFRVRQMVDRDTLEAPMCDVSVVILTHYENEAEERRPDSEGTGMPRGDL
ncbi:hypothetical protein BD309DRAFT_961044 [Dichomitus squalens]|uniref:Uncharacterized protein n=1 Tax=Dichomitus squalens TaxID=114155 RepID=A0A4Q9NUQ2_9APHY|nr:hypothetical protein BD309DRAFT_961044 [Dichomitus squalens]TBU57556.1 hypothetical protein BD310DRAFT_928883 [Dichomitus squalens]